MATTPDLMGLGMTPQLATKLGNNVTSANGTGTSQTTGTSIRGGTYLATPTASNTAFTLDIQSPTTRLLFFENVSSTQTALVFPPVGGTINGGSVNASVSIPPLSGALIEPVSGAGVTPSNWWCNFGGTVATTLSPTFNSVVINAGSATVTPLKLTAGTVNTTAVAGAIEYDGLDFYATNAASSRAIIDTEQFIYVQAAITLVSQTGAQPIFVGASGGVLTNGEITLPLGTFEFDATVNLSALSATSGGFGFSLTAGNPAVIGQQNWEAYATKSTLATPVAWTSSWNTAASTELVTASTATVGIMRLRGTFTLTTAGPVIPNISQTTAASAIVGVGSYFRVRALGSNTVTFVGDWS